MRSFYSWTGLKSMKFEWSRSVWIPKNSGLARPTTGPTELSFETNIVLEP